MHLRGKGANPRTSVSGSYHSNIFWERILDGWSRHLNNKAERREHYLAERGHIPHDVWLDGMQTLTMEFVRQSHEAKEPQKTAFLQAARCANEMLTHGEVKDVLRKGHHSIADLVPLLKFDKALDGVITQRLMELFGDYSPGLQAHREEQERQRPVTPRVQTWEQNYIEQDVWVHSLDILAERLSKAGIRDAAEVTRNIKQESHQGIHYLYELGPLATLTLSHERGSDITKMAEELFGRYSQSYRQHARSQTSAMGR